jgi:ketosteroid isomerase-like protein
MATLNVPDLSPDQREIWRAEQKYWELAKDGDAERLIALMHDRVTVWPQFASTPMDSTRVSEDAQIRVQRGLIAAYELSFHSIEMHGDAAIVFYTVSVTNSTTKPDAAPEVWSCITHTWVRDRDGWRLAGGMSRFALG